MPVRAQSVISNVVAVVLFEPRVGTPRLYLEAHFHRALLFPTGALASERIDLSYCKFGFPSDFNLALYPSAEPSIFFREVMTSLG